LYFRFHLCAAWKAGLFGGVDAALQDVLRPVTQSYYPQAFIEKLLVFLGMIDRERDSILPNLTHSCGEVGFCINGAAKFVKSLTPNAGLSRRDLL
jgi:hypothetical protein